MPAEAVAPKASAKGGSAAKKGGNGASPAPPPADGEKKKAGFKGPIAQVLRGGSVPGICAPIGGYEGIAGRAGHLC